jgi:DNA mismatch repair protein MSH6
MQSASQRGLTPAIVRIRAAAAAGYDHVGTTESESDATVSSASTVAPRKKAAPAARKKAAAAPPARPSIKPTQSGASASGGGGGGGSANAFLTQAEIRRAADKQQKKDDMDCFDFLVDLRDADGHRPGDEDYDPRTLYIPRKAWDKFTPFETQVRRKLRVARAPG